MSTPANSPPAPQQLAEVLELERLDSNLFRSRVNQVNFNRSLFGGQILGQGLQAAAQTVDAERQAHSLHGYFLLAGASDIPVIYLSDYFLASTAALIHTVPVAGM